MVGTGGTLCGVGQLTTLWVLCNGVFYCLVGYNGGGGRGYTPGVLFSIRGVAPMGGWDAEQTSYVIPTLVGTFWVIFYHLLLRLYGGFNAVDTGVQVVYVFSSYKKRFPTTLTLFAIYLNGKGYRPFGVT